MVVCFNVQQVCTDRQTSRREIFTTKPQACLDKKPAFKGSMKRSKRWCSHEQSLIRTAIRAPGFRNLSVLCSCTQTARSWKELPAQPIIKVALTSGHNMVRRGQGRFAFTARLTEKLPLGVKHNLDQLPGISTM